MQVLEGTHHQDKTETIENALELIIEREYRALLKTSPVITDNTEFLYTLWYSTWPELRTPVETRIQNLFNDDPSDDIMQIYRFVVDD